MSSHSSSTRQGVELFPVFQGLCAGLDPVLQAVAELPESGLPIPSSAGHRVKQFFLQQLDAATAAGSTSQTAQAGGSGLSSEYSKDVQTIQQLQQKLEELATFWWDRPGLSHATPGALKAVQLVANAARVVARQQVAERNTPAYNTLLAQGYRAGLIAQGCAALKATLGLHITTHQQLAHAAVTTHRVFRSALDSFHSRDMASSAALEGLLWTSLRCLHGSSGSSSDTPEWQPDFRMASVVLGKLLTVVVESADTSVVPSDFQVYLTGFVLPTSIATGQVPSRPAQNSSSSSSSKAPGTSASSVASTKGTSSSSSSSSSTATPATSSSRQSGGNVRSAVQTGLAASGSTSTQGNAPTATSRPFGPTRVDMSLPLDECALLVQHCSNLGPVLTAVADWVAAGMSDTALLRDPIIQYMIDEICGRQPGRGCLEMVSDGPRRRTLLPLYTGKTCVLSSPDLTGLCKALDSKLYGMFASSQALTPDAMAAIEQVVFEVATEVASAFAIGPDSQAFDAFAQATIYAGAVVSSCAALNKHLGIKLLTVQQLVEAVKLINERCCMTRGRVGPCS